MSVPEQPASLREVEHLRDDVRALAGRLDGIDASGTRGVSGLQVQVTDLAKDIGQIRASVAALRDGFDGKLEKHLDGHKDDQRWKTRMTWTIIAGSATVVGTGVGLIVALIDIIGKIHG